MQGCRDGLDPGCQGEAKAVFLCCFKCSLLVFHTRYFHDPEVTGVWCVVWCVCHHEGRTETGCV